jgi:signal transduction histidine kinase
VPKRTAADELREQLAQARAQLGQEQEKVGRLSGALEHYRATNKALQERLERAQELGNQGQERLLRVVDQLVDLKREGFTAPYTNPANLEKLDVDLDPVILDAIGQVAGENKSLSRQLVQYAMSELRLGDIEPGEVARKVLQGGSPPEEEEEG